MENFNYIDLPRQREFGRKINAAIEFYKQNFKGLVKSTLIISGPLVVILSLVMSFSETASFFTPGMTPPDEVLSQFASPTFWLQLLLLIGVGVVTWIMAMSSTNNYVLLYQERRTNKIEPQDVWQRVQGSFGLYIGSAILLALVFIPLALLSGVLFYGIAQGGVFLAFIFGMALFVFWFYISIPPALLFYIRSKEKIGFIEALKRSFYLTQGKWWSTFGLLFVLQLMVGLASIIFSIPFIIVSTITTLHSIENIGQAAGPDTTTQILLFLTNVARYLGQMVLMPVFYLGIIFQYYNLVELKEAKGLMSQLANFGQPEAPKANTEEDY